MFELGINFAPLVWVLIVGIPLLIFGSLIYFFISYKKDLAESNEKLIVKNDNLKKKLDASTERGLRYLGLAVKQNQELNQCKKTYQQFVSDAAHAGYLGNEEAADVVWNNPKSETEEDESKEDS